MSNPVLSPSKTLQLDRSPTEIKEAIAFIPALSAKYKIATADPKQQMFTLYGAELSGNEFYIDISYSSDKHSRTVVTLKARKSSSIEKSSDVSMINQHFDTVFNLLSDSLALEPSAKSRLLSTTANEKSAGEHHLSQATAEAAKKVFEEEQATTSTRQLLIYVVSTVLLIAVLYGLYRYFQP
jgi:hypothetical protein